MNKKKRMLIGVGSIVGLVILYYLYGFFMFVETDNAQVEAHTVLMAAKVPGYIREVLVTDGQRVKAGEVLVRIDSREYKSAVDAARSEVLSLEARKKDAEKNFVRLRELFSKAVVSQQQFDAATASYNEVKAKYDSAMARVTQADINLEYTQIKAPSDGIIAKSAAEVGQLAGPGMALMGFVSSESRWIMANFKETEIADVKVGRAVDIKIDADSSRTLKGEVESISSATGATFTLLPPDNATGNFTKVVQRVPVKIKLNGMSVEERESLQAGLSAVVKVHRH